MLLSYFYQDADNTKEVILYVYTICGIDLYNTTTNNFIALLIIFFLNLIKILITICNILNKAMYQSSCTLCMKSSNRCIHNQNDQMHLVKVLKMVTSKSF